MLGHVENLGILGTKGANPPRSSKDLAKLFEFCTMRIMRRRIADADASSRHPLRMQANHTGVRMPAKAETNICASWCLGCCVFSFPPLLLLLLLLPPVLLLPCEFNLLSKEDACAEDRSDCWRA